MRTRLPVILLAACLSVPSFAAAQDEGPLSLALTTPDAPAEPSTHPDEGLMIAGGVTFLVAYVAALSVSLPEIANYCGGGYPSCDYLGLQLIPFAHPYFGGLGMFSNPIFIVTELVGALIFAGGAAHHHPDEPIAVGEVRATPMSLTIGF